MPKHADIGVLGGGVIGSAVALQLAAAGLTVTVLEMLERLGEGVSGAAIGGITPVSDDYCRSELKPLAKWSTQKYSSWVADLANDSGIEIPFLDTGLLFVALTEKEWQQLNGPFAAELASLQIDFSVLTQEEVLLREPLLTQSAIGAIHIPIEGAVEPPVLLRAITHLLTSKSNVKVITECQIQSVQEEGSQVLVKTSLGNFEFNKVVVCLGIGAAAIFPPLRQVLLPVRGQALELSPPDISGYALNHHIYAHIDDVDDPLVGAYFVPRADGRVALGVTYEPSMQEAINTALGVKKVLDAGMTVIPTSAGWRFNRVWAGVRPGTVNGKPIIGYWQGSEKILMATGHFGLGVTLAPVTAQIIAELLGVCSPDVTKSFDFNNPL